MTDHLTTEIRRALTELVDAAPLAPDLERRPTSRPAAGPPRRLIAVALPLAVIVGSVVWLNDGDPQSTTVEVGEPTPSSPPFQGEPREPTLVAPTVLPAGLQFVEGGRSAQVIGGGNTILLAAADGRTARLTWSEVTMPGGCPGPVPMTTIRGSSASGPSGPPAPATPEEAVFRGTGDSGQLVWCGEGIYVTLSSEGMGEAATRSLATTVRREAGRPGSLAITPPAGFASGRIAQSGTRYALTYGLTPGRRLRVHIRPGWTADLRLLKAEVGAVEARDVTVGGRPGFVREGTTASLTLLYDDRSIVSLFGTGLTPDELLETSASLRPADPAIAPDTATQPGLCDRLGLCG